MKKVWMIGLFLISCLMVGCGKGKVDYEGIMGSYAKDYYQRYMSSIEGLTNPVITLERLQIINDREISFGNPAPYDLTDLDKCSKTSKATLTISNGKITNIEYEMNCK